MYSFGDVGSVALQDRPPAARSLELTEEVISEYVHATFYASQAKRNAAVLRSMMRKGLAYTVRGIREFLMLELHEGKTPKTLANFKSALSAFGVHLRRHGVIETNPCHEVELPKLEELPPIILTRAEAAEAIRVATGRACVGQVIIALYAGLRAGEICRLKWTDLDMQGKGILVKKTKGKRFRVVPMCKRIAAMLEKQRELTGQYKFVFPQTKRERWTHKIRLIADAPRSMNYMMDVIVPIRDALPTLRELPPKQTCRGWHAFRHTFASWAVAANVSIYKLARWLGHHDVRTTQRYARLLQQYDPEIELVGKVKLASPTIGVGVYDD